MQPMVAAAQPLLLAPKTFIGGSVEESDVLRTALAPLPGVFTHRGNILRPVSTAKNAI